jgi:hypothetical protein
MGELLAKMDLHGWEPGQNPDDAKGFLKDSRSRE